ncbi:XRE family transcriptional regulator, partial [Burkholderia multivorans]
MNSEEMIIDGPLARAARILCQVSAADVAAQAEIDKADLKDYEKCRDDLTSEQE